MPVDPVRDAAIDVLLRVDEKFARLDQALARTIDRKQGRISSRGRRFLSQLVYGTVRHASLCDFVYESRLDQSPDKLPNAIRLILRMGVFQSLFCDNVTKPAMVHTSVDLAKKRGNPGVAKLVNAVLRKVPEDVDELRLPDRFKNLSRYLSVRYSMPRGMVKKLIADFGPDIATAIADASCDEAPLTACANTIRTSRDDLLNTTLPKAEAAGAAIEEFPDAFILETVGKGLTSLKSFQHGDFWMQDPASMLAGHLLDAQPGERIHDCCAAPGTKSVQIAVSANDKAHVVASDLDGRRVALIQENAERLRLGSVSTVFTDATQPPFRECSFDRVLLDAPCSGLGTLRRHPDIKWRIASKDLPRLAGQQRDLLRSAIALCKNGGVIVYSVCTFTPEETHAVVDDVLSDGGLTLENGPDWLNKWRISQGKYQTLPGSGPWDGFFLTRLRKDS